jgi:hypothetical protein
MEDGTSGSPISLVWIKIFPIGASTKFREKDVLIAPPARTISTPQILADNSSPWHSCPPGVSILFGE